MDGWQGVCGGVGLGSVAIGTVGTSSCGGLALRASELEDTNRPGAGVRH